MNAMRLGEKNRHLVNTAGCSSSTSGAPCARHERTNNPRRISSEFPTRHAFSCPWARKAAVPFLLLRDMFAVGFNRGVHKMLLFCSYWWALQLESPGKYVACILLKWVALKKENTLTLLGKKKKKMFHLSLWNNSVHPHKLLLKGLIHTKTTG